MPKAEYVVGMVLVGCALLMWGCGNLYRHLLEAYEQTGTLYDSEYSWFFRLILNLVGYSTILLPGFLLFKYLKKSNYFDKTSSNGYVYKLLYACFGDYPERLGETRAEPPEGVAHEGLELAFCFTGLMGAYLLWGLLQEKIMTQSYVLADGSAVRFEDSQLLVFVNRAVACALAALRLACARRPLVVAPLYRFSYCSLTNILSAWCQYEALKYVSFPTQVLSKSCKVIPVMVMGRLVSRQQYAAHEYASALLISAGMALFMFASHDDSAASAATSVSGLCLLALYLVCDGFTAAWQAALFGAHAALRPPHMMAAVTACSALLAAAALAHRPHWRALVLLQHPVFVADCLLLSASSALGQLLIYRTIARFGAVVFTIIMTLRQAVSILVSCLVYGHAVSAAGALGVAMVFGAVLLRLHCRRARARPAARAPATRAPPAAPPPRVL